MTYNVGDYVQFNEITIQAFLKSWNQPLDRAGVDGGRVISINSNGNYIIKLNNGYICETSIGSLINVKELRKQKIIQLGL